MASLCRFDRATALSLSSEGVFQGCFDPGFWAVVGPNGSYVSAIVLRAMQCALGDPARAPRALHLRFLAAASAGDFEVEVRTLRAGRSVTALAARIVQAKRALVEASGVFGVKVSEVAYCDARMPEALPFDQAPEVPKFIELNHRYDMRVAFGGPFRGSERACSGGYLRLAEPRDADALTLAALWDAWAPTPLFRKMDARFGGAAPTLEASLYFRTQLPRPSSRPDDYYLLHASSQMASDGYFEESAEIWSLDGVLLAQSRQLAMLY